MARVVNLRPVLSGINAVLKSGAVASMVSQQAQAASARCNALSGTARAEYGSEPVELRYVAGARVYAANPAAVHDNLRNNTLKKGCGC